MRFADLSGGLLGAITGNKDLASNGLLGLIPGAPNANGSLGLIGSIAGYDKPLHELLGLPGWSGTKARTKNDLAWNERSLPYGHPDRMHGFGDYGADGWYKGDLPGGGPITDAEKRKYGHEY